MPVQRLAKLLDFLREDAGREYRKVLELLNIEPQEDCLKRAVAFADLGNMKQLERTDYFGKTAMRPTDPGNPESYKVRRGKIGGYTDYLSREDLDYIDRVLIETRCPWYQPVQPV